MQFSGSIDARLVPITVYSLFQIPITEEMLVDIYNYPTGITGVATYLLLRVGNIFAYLDVRLLVPNQKIKPLYIFGCLLLVSTAVIICGQRSSILGLLAGFMFLASDKEKNMSYSIFLVLSGVIIFITLLSNAFSEFLYRFDYKYADFFGSKSDQLRLESIYAGINAFMSNPLFGVSGSEIKIIPRPT